MRKVLILLATLVLAAACSTKAPDIEKKIDELLQGLTNFFRNSHWKKR